MRRLLPVLAVLLAAAALPRFAPAQGTTKDNIDRAIAMYKAFNVEGARPLLQAIVSPAYLQPVTPAERVAAYKYLGASYALLDKQDTAITFFVAALDFDPFTDLDLEEFSPAELSAFNMARSRIFKVGVKPVLSKVINPRVDSTAYVFRLISTSRASLMVVDLVNQGDTTKKENLLRQPNEGPRQIRWLGVLQSGLFADSGIYMLRVQATKEGSSQPVEAQQFFRLEHAFEPLEDTLPSFTSAQLLQEQIPTRAPYMDLIKGVVAGGMAFGLATVAMNSYVKGWQTHALSAAAVSVGAGTWSFFYRRANRSIGDNVRENARRQAQRAAFNAAVQARNRVRLDNRFIILTPVTGFSR